MSGTPSDSPSTQRLLDGFRWDKLSHDEALVLRRLREHQGRENAISVPALASVLGLGDRHAQQIVKDLVEKRGIPIGSSSSASCPGWYLIVSEDERKANHAALLARARSILARAKAYEPGRNALLGQILGEQVPLPMGGRRG